jgi:hypothetical protein
MTKITENERKVLTPISAPWGWNPIIDLMDAAHCRNLLSMSGRVLATLGWTDVDIRQMKRIAGA